MNHKTKQRINKRIKLRKLKYIFKTIKERNKKTGRKMKINEKVKKINIRIRNGKFAHEIRKGKKTENKKD